MSELLRVARALARGESIDADLTPSLLASLDHHGLGVLAASSLLRDRSDLSPELRSDLASRVRSAFIQTTAIGRDTATITGHLHRSGIPSLLLKGSAWSQLAYGDPALRAFADIDLLIRSGDIFAAKEALRAIGWTSEITISEGRAKLLARSGYQLVFRNASRRVELDLHWRLVPLYYGLPDIEHELWKEKRELDFNSGRVATLGNEMQIVSAIVNGSKSMWNRLELITTFAALCRSTASDLAQLEVTCRRLRLGRMFAIATTLAARLDMLELPTTASKEVARIVDGIIEAYSRTRVESAASHVVLHTADTMWQVARAVGVSLVVPNETELARSRLHDRLLPLLYVKRPIRLLMKHVFRVTDE